MYEYCQGLVDIYEIVIPNTPFLLCDGYDIVIIVLLIVNGISSAPFSSTVKNVH